MKMSVTSNATKDTIKLYYYRNHEMPIVNAPTDIYGCIDIAPLLGEDASRFLAEHIIGVRSDFGNTGEQQPLYHADLANKIEFLFNRLIDATMVNEKQKQATKDLFAKDLYDLFHKGRYRLSEAMEDLGELPE